MLNGFVVFENSNEYEWNMNISIERFYDISSIWSSSQHLKWIKKVHQSCPKTRTHFGFRTTLMKGFDPLQMLTTIL